MKFSIKREKFIKCKFAMLHIRLCAHHQWLWKRFGHSRFWFVLSIRFIELAVEMCAPIKWHFALQYRISKHTHTLFVAFHFFVKNFAQKTSMTVIAKCLCRWLCVCARKRQSNRVSIAMRLNIIRISHILLERSKLQRSNDETMRWEKKNNEWHYIQLFTNEWRKNIERKILSKRRRIFDW